MALLHKHVAELLTKISDTGQVANNDRAMARIYAESLDKREDTEHARQASTQRPHERAH